MKRLCAILMTVLLSAACANNQPGVRSDRAMQLDIYKAHAGESRNRAVFPRLDGWRSFPGAYIAVRTRAWDYYLLRLEPACASEFRTGSDIRLALKQQTRNSLSRFDRVGFGDQWCQILEIQPLDRKALEAELEQAGFKDAFLRRAPDSR